MSKAAPLIQELSECRDKSLAGGKAVNLGTLIRAGFSVPPGFVVTTCAYRVAREGNGGEMPVMLAEEIRGAYRRMGSPSVAVRSSATAEDMADASMAGQYETFLDIADEEQLLDAVRRCWASLDSPRTRTYLAEKGIDLNQVSMAVVVQRLVAADVAGVLFSANPQTGSRREMLIEASWGLGEAVVSGRVQPDVLRVDGETGRVLAATIADKQVWIPPGEHEEKLVEEEKRKAPSLRSADVSQLWQLGRRAADYFGSPQDIEWAIDEGKLFLLQARPITTLGTAEAYEQLLQGTRARLREMVEKGRGPWVLHNISETLPHATPLTWSVIKRFMSGSGGFGEMYRMAGFEPSERVCTEGFLERIGGKVYMDTAMAGEMFFEGFPFQYDLELLKSNPDAGQSPPTIPVGGVWERVRAGRRIGRIQRGLRGMVEGGEKRRHEGTKARRHEEGEEHWQQAASGTQAVDPVAVDESCIQGAVSSRGTPRDLATTTDQPDPSEYLRMTDRAVRNDIGKSDMAIDEELRGRVIPSFVRWCEGEKKRDLGRLAVGELIELWQEREKRVMGEFAAWALLPSLVAGMVLGDLRGFVEESFWDEEPEELVQALSSGGEADRTVLANARLREVGVGTRSVEEWLAEFGHRAPAEFDLATPRWREQREELLAMAERLKEGADPLELHGARREQAAKKMEELGRTLSARDRRELERLVGMVHRYLPFREDGKFYLMMGYDLLRDVALEAGRRLEIGEDVFQLSLEELFDALRVGFAPHHLIGQRKVVFEAEKRLVLPQVIDGEAIGTLGEPPRVETSGSYAAFAVSAGVARGPVRIVKSVQEAGELGKGYVLVCPSTDPGWTPLFVNAAGLVLECGGSLSHGAVVAREMGIPAVVLAGATELLEEGEEVEVDGRNGRVRRESDEATKRRSDEGGEERKGESEKGRRGEGEEHGQQAARGARRNGDGGFVKPQAAEESGSCAGDSPSPRPSPSRGEGAERLGRSLALPNNRSAEADPTGDSADTRIPREMVPPVVGRRERMGAMLRNWGAVGWGVYLAAAFGLPEGWVYWPSMKVLDWMLWPIVRALGKPGAVGVIAAALAVLTMVAQLLLTDNRRLREAKRREKLLTREALKLPKGSARRRVMLEMGLPVQMRVAMAAFVPLGVLLGPLVMTFAWFPLRVDVPAWNPAAGTSMRVTATIDSEWREAVTVEMGGALRLDESEEASKRLKPIRETLERHLEEVQQPSDLGNVAWEVREAAERVRREYVEDLKGFLEKGVPPQDVSWRVHSEEKAEGRFAIRVRAEGKEPVTVYAVLGDGYPPEMTEVEGGKGSPVKAVRIKYDPPKRKPLFWAPLAWASSMRESWSGLKYWEAGWLMTYLAAYLPAMFAARWGLRVA